MAISHAVTDTFTNQSQSGGTLTVSSADLGVAASDRIIVCGVNWDDGASTATSGTINGETATVISIGTSDQGCALLVAAVPDDATGDIVVNFNNSSPRFISGEVRRVVGADSTISDSGTDSDTGHAQMDIQLDVVAGGLTCLVTAQRRDDGTEAAKTGWTETSDLGAAQAAIGEYGYAEEAGDDTVTYSADWDGADRSSFAAVHLAPVAASGSTGTGAIDTTVPTLSGAGVAGRVGSGAINSTLPVLNGAGTASGPVTGSGDIDALLPTLSGSGVIGRSGEGAIEITVPVLDGSGAVGRVGSGSILSPLPTLGGAGVVGRTGSGAITSPLPILNGVGTGVELTSFLRPRRTIRNTIRQAEYLSIFGKRGEQ